jgi:hypothetical protein
LSPRPQFLHFKPKFPGFRPKWLNFEMQRPRCLRRSRGRIIGFGGAFQEINLDCPSKNLIGAR